MSHYFSILFNQYVLVLPYLRLVYAWISTPTSEDVLTTHYYQFPQEDYNPDWQIPPEDSPDDQQPSRPTTPPPSSSLSDFTYHSPPQNRSPSTCALEEPRRGIRLCNPCILPDNAYGDRPPVEIEQDLQDPSSSKPTNEEDDLGTLYSATYWNRITAAAAPVVSIPTQYRDVIKLLSEEQKLWRKAMEKKVKSIDERNVWNFVNLPPGHTPVKGRWGYAVKSNGQKKAYFVAKGFTQIYGIDFKET